MDIRDTVASTSKATFSVMLPVPGSDIILPPAGTGFFVSPDGYFITAAHVVCDNGSPKPNINKAILRKESKLDDILRLCQFVDLVDVIETLDFALLKVDVDKNRQTDWFKSVTVLPHIKISLRPLTLGEPVYSFGYPLPDHKIQTDEDRIITIISTELFPRATSCIVSSVQENTQAMSRGGAKFYEVDKAFNFGNSGGPIVATDTGHAHAVVSAFQPVFIPQEHLPTEQGEVPKIMVPSLYGVAMSLHNDEIVKICSEYGIPVLHE